MASKHYPDLSLSHPVFGEAGAGLDAAGPPYQVTTTNFMFFLVEFDRQAAQAALPSAHTFWPEQPGFVCLYLAPVGWGLAPYGSFFVAIPVKGHDSPDGSCGYFMAAGTYSDRAGDILPRFYNARLHKSEVRQVMESGIVEGEAGPANAPIARLSYRQFAGATKTPLMAGVHNYLGELNDGSLTAYPIAYSAEFTEVTEAHIEFTEHASPLLRSLQPSKVLMASHIPVVPITINSPRPITATSTEIALEGARLALLDLIGRLGRAAALIAGNGDILYMNQDAQHLLKGLVQRNKLRLKAERDQHLLDSALVTAVEEGPAALPAPVAVGDANRERPILAQALPIAPTLVGQRAALVLFSDPLAPNSTDPAPTLEMLGLTHSEAKIAALVGSGRSVPEAAQVLELSSHTVQSALKAVYLKLGINKQSELGRLVARLDGFGAPLSRASSVTAFGS